MATILTRYGDGTPLTMSEKELMQDLEAGTRDAAERGNIPALSKEDLDHLFEIFSLPYRFVSVEPGNEVVLTYDAGTLKIRRVGVNVDRIHGARGANQLCKAHRVPTRSTTIVHDRHPPFNTKRTSAPVNRGKKKILDLENRTHQPEGKW